jgi:hypothetical protein
MRRLIARNLSYRVVAVLCFAMGIAWHLWFVQSSKEPIESRFLFKPLTTPETLLEARRIWGGGYKWVGPIHTCGAYFAEFDNPVLTRAARLREQACLIESEEARKLIIANWRDKKKTYFVVEYPCPDCRAVSDALIEQNKSGEWQMTVRERPEKANSREPHEVIAISLKRRPATAYDEQKHVVGESILVLVDADGDEVLTL